MKALRQGSLFILYIVQLVAQHFLLQYATLSGVAHFPVCLDPLLEQEQRHPFSCHSLHLPLRARHWRACQKRPKTFRSIQQNQSYASQNILTNQCNVETERNQRRHETTLCLLRTPFISKLRSSISVRRKLWILCTFCTLQQIIYCKICEGGRVNLELTVIPYYY